LPIIKNRVEKLVGIYAGEKATFLERGLTLKGLTQNNFQPISVGDSLPNAHCIEQCYQ